MSRQFYFNCSFNSILFKKFFLHNNFYAQKSFDHSTEILFTDMKWFEKSNSVSLFRSVLLSSLLNQDYIPSPPLSPFHFFSSLLFLRLLILIHITFFPVLSSSTYFHLYFHSYFYFTSSSSTLFHSIPFDHNFHFHSWIFFKSRRENFRMCIFTVLDLHGSVRQHHIRNFQKCLKKENNIMELLYRGKHDRNEVR